MNKRDRVKCITTSCSPYLIYGHVYEIVGVNSRGDYVQVLSAIDRFSWFPATYFASSTKEIFLTMSDPQLQDRLDGFKIFDSKTLLDLQEGLTRILNERTDTGLSCRHEERSIEV